jgi:hypothetical protein
MSNVDYLTDNKINAHIPEINYLIKQKMCPTKELVKARYYICLFEMMTKNESKKINEIKKKTEKIYEELKNTEGNENLISRIQSVQQKIKNSELQIKNITEGIKQIDETNSELVINTILTCFKILRECSWDFL